VVSKQINPKPILPPFGKFLVSRINFNNLPDRVHVEVGGDAYRLAKNLNQRRDIAALVLPPGKIPPILNGLFLVLFVLSIGMARPHASLLKTWRDVCLRLVRHWWQFILPG